MKMILEEKEKKMWILLNIWNSMLPWGVPLLKISEKYNHYFHYFFQRPVISDTI